MIGVLIGMDRQSTTLGSRQAYLLFKRGMPSRKPGGEKTAAPYPNERVGERLPSGQHGAAKRVHRNPN